MKKYKLKEFLKNYIHPDYKHYNSVLGNQDWYKLEWTHEALEEVEVELELAIRGAGKQSLMKTSNEKWTIQESRDIKQFLNVFGTWDKMLEYSDDWMVDDVNTDDSFEFWLNEKVK